MGSLSYFDRDQRLFAYTKTPNRYHGQRSLQNLIDFAHVGGAHRGEVNIAIQAYSSWLELLG